MRLKLLFIAVLLFSFIQFGFSDGKGPACTTVHNGKFKYRDFPSSIIEIKGNKHVEYNKEKNYRIQSTLEWVSDCEYNLTIVKVDAKDMSFAVGDKMNVVITAVNGTSVYYKANYKGNITESVMIKID
ncbi:MAG: hypothetical protein JST82_05530 [Bacteroidetes bacterium]|nr:hypothetical protein [Bacteroidota bacterium]